MNYCPNCGKEIPENAKYCPSCGSGDSHGARQVTEQRTSGMAIASLIAGLIGILLIPIIPSIFAIIFGGVGMSQSNRPGVKGHGMAVAGLVLGIIGLIEGIGAAVFLVLWLIIW